MLYLNIETSDHQIENRLSYKIWKENFKRLTNKSSFLEKNVYFSGKYYALFFSYPYGKDSLLNTYQSLRFNIYLLGDISLYSKKSIFEEIIDSYLNNFSNLFELPFLYNLIIFDNEKEVCYVLTDSIHTYPLYYIHNENSTLISNTQKSFVANTNLDLSFNTNEFLNIFLTGVHSPSNTLINNVLRTKTKEYISVYPFKLKKVINSKDISFIDDSIDQVSNELFKITKSHIDSLDITNVDILFSGGNDSVSLYNLLNNKHRNIECITYIADNDDLNKYNLDQVTNKLSLSPKLVSYNPLQILETQEKAIWYSESEATGINALNTSLEFLLSQEISSDFWVTGDYFHGHLKYCVTIPNTFFYKIRLILHYSLLSYTQAISAFKHLDIKSDIDDYLSHYSSHDIYYNIHNMLCPNSLFRLRNSAQNYQSTCFFPTRSLEILNFVNSIPKPFFNKFENYNGESLLAIFNKFLRHSLGECYDLKRPKAWAAPLIDVDGGNQVQDIIRNDFITSSSFLNDIFGDVSHFLLNNHINKIDNFIFSLWSLDIYNDLFIKRKLL